MPTRRRRRQNRASGLLPAMGGSLLRFLTAMSALLCVVLAVFWVKSHKATSAVSFNRFDGRCRAMSWQGSLVLDNMPQVDKERGAYRDAVLRFAQDRIDLGNDLASNMEQQADATYGSKQFKSLEAKQRKYIDDSFKVFSPKWTVRL